jgi:hypothetical protein
METSSLIDFEPYDFRFTSIFNAYHDVEFFCLASTEKKGNFLIFLQNLSKCLISTSLLMDFIKRS